MKKDLTQGSILVLLLQYSLPYLLSTFLQTFYALTDLFIVSFYCDTAAISAVSSSSQVLHLVTVIIAGLCTGVTILTALSYGKGNIRDVWQVLKAGSFVLLGFSFILMAAAIPLVVKIVNALKIPLKAQEGAKDYLTVCFIGIPFIAAFNVFSALFRGAGDTKTPLVVISITGLLNIVFDVIFVKVFAVMGAAIATLLSQILSVIALLLLLQKKRKKLGNKGAVSNGLIFFAASVLKIGLPIAAQELLIQLSFLVITRIANNLGLKVSAAVGVTEKVISLLFLVNSAMLSAVSVVAAQNIGAHGKGKRARDALKYGILCVVVFGGVVAALCQIIPSYIIAIFCAADSAVIELGASYLRSYAVDCVFAGVHFCFSGYFCACGKSLYSFIHNMISVVVARIPLAYLAARHFSGSLYSMGWAAPIGSLLSCAICVALFIVGDKNEWRRDT